MNSQGSLSPRHSSLPRVESRSYREEYEWIKLNGELKTYFARWRHRQLNSIGVASYTGLPLWSANALTTDAGLNVLRQVHLDYLSAGADIITTNTLSHSSPVFWLAKACPLTN